MDELNKIFIQSCPIKYALSMDINWNDFTIQMQLQLLEDTVNHPIVVKYPPTNQYQSSFLKSIIKKLEDNDVEICDELYEKYTELIALPSDTTQVAYKTYLFGEQTHVTIKESVNYISQGTTGLCTWQAAKYLAEWSLENEMLFHNRNVLEVGCGVGLTGLIIRAACNPKHYIFSDCHTDVLELLQENVKINMQPMVTINCDKCKRKCLVKANDSSCKTYIRACQADHQHSHCSSCTEEIVSTNDKIVNKQPVVSSVMDEINHEKVEQNFTGVDVNNIDNIIHCIKTQSLVDKGTSILRLDWESVDPGKLKQLGQNTDIVLAADVVYDNTIIPSLVKVLKNLLCGPVSTAYIASTVRNEETIDTFHRQLDMCNLQYRKICGPSTKLLLYDCSTDIELLEIKNTST